MDKLAKELIENKVLLKENDAIHSILASLELLKLAIVHKDPYEELLVRVKDIIQDVNDIGKY